MQFKTQQPNKLVIYKFFNDCDLEKTTKQLLWKHLMTSLIVKPNEQM